MKFQTTTTTTQTAESPKGEKAGAASFEEMLATLSEEAGERVTPLSQSEFERRYGRLPVDDEG